MMLSGGTRRQIKMVGLSRNPTIGRLSYTWVLRSYPDRKLSNAKASDENHFLLSWMDKNPLPLVEREVALAVHADKG